MSCALTWIAVKGNREDSKTIKSRHNDSKAQVLKLLHMGQRILQRLNGRMIVSTAVGARQ